MDGAWHPQILDQTNGIAERFNQQVMAGQAPWLAGACAGLKCPEQHAFRRLLTRDRSQLRLRLAPGRPGRGLGVGAGEEGTTRLVLMHAAGSSRM